jgi:hypothetical protein
MRDGYRVVTVLRGPSKTFQQLFAVLDSRVNGRMLEACERNGALRVRPFHWPPARATDRARNGTHPHMDRPPVLARRGYSGRV